jgi:release factor glutamine methyltransferase
VNLQQFLAKAQRQLEEAGVTTARLDVLVLLEDTLGKNRAQLLAHPELELAQTQVDQLQKLLDQRAQHVPLAYVRGKTEFYGREFLINRAVLEPRPESEAMIVLLKKLTARPLKNKAGHNLSIADVGTGSGALGITAALELPGSQVTLVDIDKAAIKVAEQNCERFELELPCVVDNLLAHADKRGVKLDIVLANLPYVPDDYQINTAAMHEPRVAIFGGPDGLELYRQLFEQLEELEPHYVLTESLPFQHEALAETAKRHGFAQAQEEDFIQVFERN